MGRNPWEGRMKRTHKRLAHCLPYPRLSTPGLTHPCSITDRPSRGNCRGRFCARVTSHFHYVTLVHPALAAVRILGAPSVERVVSSLIAFVARHCSPLSVCFFRLRLQLCSTVRRATCSASGKKSLAFLKACWAFSDSPAKIRRTCSFQNIALRWG